MLIFVLPKMFFARNFLNIHLTIKKRISCSVGFFGRNENMPFEPKENWLNCNMQMRFCIIHCLGKCFLDLAVDH